MKKIITILFLAAFATTYSQQAFKGAGDVKVNIGANLQSGGSGIQGSVDFGLGENFSYGFLASYLLSVNDFSGIYGTTIYNAKSPNFLERFNAEARLNANLSSVIGVEQLDIYPGLNLGVHNFGGHLGARFFFTNGFGVFTEVKVPIAKYGKDDTLFYNLNNQVTFSVGASFNL